MRKRNPLPPAEELRRLFDYHPLTGVLLWRYREDRPLWWNARYAGRAAGNHDRSSGYIKVGLNGALFVVHRIIWVLVTGAEPNEDIDHENLDKTDNRWANLREATRSGNNANRRAAWSSSTGLKGASFHRQSGKYRAQIRAGGKVLWLGEFDTPEEAHTAYCVAAKKYHGQFARGV